LYVLYFALSLLLLLYLNIKIHEDACIFRNRLKTCIKSSIKHHYYAAFNPDLGAGFGQAEYQATITENLKALVKPPGLFLRGDGLDGNVGVLFYVQAYSNSMYLEQDTQLRSSYFI